MRRGCAPTSPSSSRRFHGKPLAYLNSAATSQKPRQVLDAMTEFYETSYSNVHRGVYALGERATAGLEGAREKVRAFVNAPTEREIIFVRNATEALNLVAYAYGLARLKPGDVVLATQLEHHSNFVPWQYVANRTGADVPDHPDRRQRRPAARRGRRPREREGRRREHRLELARHDRATPAGSPTGRTSAARSSPATPRRPLRTCGSTSSRSAPTSSPSRATRCCGPSGIGFLWGRTELLLEMEPFLLGGHMIRNVGDEQTTWGELPAKFEAGTSPVAEAVGLGAAIDYLEAVGLEAIEAHEHQLAAYALDALARHPRHHALRAAARAARRDRDVRRRGRSPARHGADPRPRGDRDPRRPPLLPAADAQARRRRRRTARASTSTPCEDEIDRLVAGVRKAQGADDAR